MGGPHRVILVRAENGAHIGGASIPPHIPKLRIKPEDIVGIDGFPYGLEPAGDAGVWRLAGVCLTLQGTDEQSFVHEPEYDAVPRLGLLTSETPGLSKEVTQKEQAACYFDFRAGRLSAGKTIFGAISTVITVKTTETPALSVMCFWNRKTSVIRLRPNATIDIEHTGAVYGDADKDFLLHYLVLNYVPDDAKVPPEEHEKKLQLEKLPGNISIGCSNSQYP